MTKPAPPPAASVRVAFLSLGCAKNLVDTEVMLGHLDRAGAVLVREPAGADVVVVNTCGFIEAAREESVRTILEAAELKASGAIRRLVVAGCLVQRYAAELRESLPEVDAWIGLDELSSVPARVGIGPGPRETAAPAAGGPPAPSSYLLDHETPRRLATPPWTAFVKVAEGCDHVCAFCAIPAIRGRFRSRPVADVVAEVSRLAAGGVREIHLVSQDTSRYGRDLAGERLLAPLLEALDGVEALRWIRVLYLHPSAVGEDLLDAMARLPRVVPYLDVPLQHAHPATLRRMGRGGSAETHLALLARARRAIPGAAIRTAFLVGFPGETETEFEELLRFVEAAGIDHAGVFAYSHEEGTPAFSAADDVPVEVKEERRARLLEAQQRIAFRALERQVGRRVEVLVEGAHPETEHLLVGRTALQAPDVDGQVLLNDGAARPGEFARVEITGTAGYDLVGRILGAS